MRYSQVDTYQVAGPGDLQLTADGVGVGVGLPDALFHLDPIEVEVDLDSLCWAELCKAGVGDAVDAGGEAGEDPRPQVQLPVRSSRPVAVVEVGQEGVVGDRGAWGGPGVLSQRVR